MPLEIIPYIHKVQYYETDQMGIVHHSNYIKWLEEARMDYLDQIGINYHTMEEMELASPIVSVSCQYKSAVSFGDSVSILPIITKYTGVKLTMSYEIHNTENGALCALAETTSCFINLDGKPISLKKEFPELHTFLLDEVLYVPDAE